MTRKIATPQGWNGSHRRYPTAFSQRVKWLAQQHNIMTLARAEPDCRDWERTHQTKSYLVSYFIWINYYVISIFERHLCKTKVVQETFVLKTRSYVTGTHLERFSLNFSSSSFVIRVNLLYSQPSLFPSGLISSLWCFNILVNHYFQVPFNSKLILYVAQD